jgi:hypothetical protein
MQAVTLVTIWVADWTFGNTSELHFRVVFVESDSWGAQDDEGVWFGLLGMLADGALDLMLCHPTVTADRTMIAAFLHPTLHSRYVSGASCCDIMVTQG